ncbi:MAG TPA: ABC transporter permease [Puia sp.]|jgi:predicted permease|nr:ABC transporter permease [Puia sp.]
MFKNYFTIAWRNLLRNKTFSIINILGLSIGMTAALLIGLWIHNELSIDRIYPKTDQLYLLNNRDTVNGEIWVWNQTPKSLVPVLKKDYPGVEDATRYMGNRFLITVGDSHFNSNGGIVDSGFLPMFGFPMLEGEPTRALSSTYNIVLTQQMAKRLFGNENPMGRTVLIDSNDNFTVTGVLKDLPSTTSFKFDYLVPWSYMAHLGWNDEQNWSNYSVATYVLLKPGMTREAFDTQVGDIGRTHGKVTAHVFTQPMSRLNLYSKAQNGQLVGDKIITVRLFTAIAAFILLIACINFMNLSTARSERRAREVGVRKVVGAARGSLIAQFIGESTLTAALAFITALFLAYISLGAFNQLIGQELAINYSSPAFWLFSIGFVLFTGLLAGSYPAFYLSSFRPAGVLKGSFKKTGTLITTRKVLVVLQFSFAILLIICTAIVFKQLRYGINRDAGYNRDQLVYFFAEGPAHDHYDAIRQEFLSSGAATSVTYLPGPITQHWSDGQGFHWPGSTTQEEQTDFRTYAATSDFVKTLGITLLQGRDIDVYKYKSDSDAVLLNESAVRTMQLKDPIGQLISRGNERFHVVGVIKDFILESPFTSEIVPMIISGPRYVWLQVVHFKLNPAHSTATDLALAEKIYHKYNPAYPFEYKFADESYAQKFKAEQQTTKLSALFAALTIFISCLGLFALAAYTAETRIREIGVRKVLGATVTSIATLLTRDFILLVLIAFLIAAPVAWFVMNNWLLNYGYRVSIGWDTFALSGLLAVAIAAITVSYQSVKAALANPVKSLRTE